MSIIKLGSPEEGRDKSVPLNVPDRNQGHCGKGGLDVDFRNTVCAE